MTWPPRAGAAGVTEGADEFIGGRTESLACAAPAEHAKGIATVTGRRRDGNGPFGPHFSVRRGELG